MGFTADRSGGVLSWVHTHPTDILGGAAASGGVVLCDDQGKVTVIDAKGGGVVSELDLGEPVKSCAVQVDGFRPSGTPRETGTLAAQIAVAVEDRDLELVTGQHLLLRELATSPDEEATKTLVELASDPRTSPALISDTRAELASRRNGAAYMLAALERHYDFLKDVLLPPPVGPLADALAAIKEKRAAPLLASHLLDPADTDDDIKRAAAALVVLAGPSERPAMKQFFAMYRAAPEDPVELADAVVAVGQALLGTDGSEGRALVDQAIRYPMTNGMVKSKLSAVVEAADAEKGAEKREGQGKSKPPSEPSPSP
jgi:outer membrane protein assembly factor BamB